jgi:hypothetical protein
MREIGCHSWMDPYTQYWFEARWHTSKTEEGTAIFVFESYCRTRHSLASTASSKSNPTGCFGVYMTATHLVCDWMPPTCKLPANGHNSRAIQQQDRADVFPLAYRVTAHRMLMLRHCRSATDSQEAASRQLPRSCTLTQSSPRSTTSTLPAGKKLGSGMSRITKSRWKLL